MENSEMTKSRNVRMGFGAAGTLRENKSEVLNN